MSVRPGAKLVTDFIAANRVAVFSTTTCPFCSRAKGLLNIIGVKFADMSLDTVPSDTVADVRAEMKKLSGQRTVPQIFIDQKSIGGYSELQEANMTGALQAILNRQ
ncbi:hypothetical protein SARC_10281 [Sphaeroforma arctica JP610]|uniref:Glutaredoxin domain-containing protein n=1 Tax=Sphaeroforma arctica JP610 TaxID=667725 RepID=A0A0L0FKF4_9EUKA|nr:hypothetical protein SARC_10281 [Sphaeroforma arctica JP610]KNC77257.1 hypothetical protein SARC_10281 [Sphaeroforma arctica JP610]|eukprot:XP_014151159.1 hypothetical protein SARC_10281 [Sphaeroforma arctica JP610]